MTDTEEQQLKNFGIEIIEHHRGLTGELAILVAVLSGVGGGLLSEIGKDIWQALKKYIAKRIIRPDKDAGEQTPDAKKAQAVFIESRIHNVPVVYYIYAGKELPAEFDMKAIAEAENEIRQLVEKGKIESHRFLGIKLDKAGKGAYLRQFTGMSSNDLLAIMVEDAGTDKIPVVDHIVAGNWFEEMGRLDLAEKHFQIAVNANPTEPRTYINLGIVQDHQGKFDKCVESWTRSAELDNRYDRLHYNLACHYGETGDAKNAAKELELAFEYGWRDVHVLLNDPCFSRVLNDNSIRLVIQKMKDAQDKTNQ
ncbi:MAG: hypothetical protein LLF86_01205 [Nitrospiraceae bacterium]|nr:hypothetical protein [Nitrospiraceae bacterium]